MILYPSPSASGVAYDPSNWNYPPGTIGSVLMNSTLVVDNLIVGIDKDDSVAALNRARIQAFIELAASKGGGNVLLPLGLIKVQPGLELRQGVHLLGQGTDEFERIEYGMFSFSRGTHLIMTGAPYSTVQVAGITNMRPYGGIVPNPDHRGAGYNDDYSLIDFTNEDATDSTAATLRNVSYGILMNRAHSSGVHNLRIALNFNGIDGYADKTTRSLGNAVDIGIMNLNSKFAYCSGFQVFGEWRISALAVLLSNMTPDTHNAVTFGLYERAQLAGYRCILVRGTDIQRITGKTANTLQIPWSPSSYYSPTGGYITPSAGAPATYTGISKSGDKVVLTGVSNTANFTVGGTAYPASNFGSSTNEFRDIYCLGWSHPSNMPACALGFAYNSCGIEVSGHNLRSTYFNNVKVHDRDCMAHLHQASQVYFNKSHGEAPQTGSTPGTTNLPRAARFIAAPGTNGQWFGEYGAGGATVSFDDDCTISELIDMFPTYPRQNGSMNKYKSSVGLCRLASVTGNVPYGQYSGQAGANNVRNYAWGTRAYTSGVDSASNRWSLYDHLNERLLLEATPQSDTAFYIADGATSGSVVVADDAVGTYIPRKLGGILLIFAENAVALPRPFLCGIVAFGAAASGTGTAGVAKLDANDSIQVVNTPVTGTTGTDGKTTVGVLTGPAGTAAVQIENRTGSQVRYRFFLIA